MKFHITNLYNFNPADELVKKQHRFADTARELGFTEMGIFSYPVETDTYNELSKRLDGVIASLEAEDTVFIQLPTGNGYVYEHLLFQKIKAYSDTKVAFILHDTKLLTAGTDTELQTKYISLYRQADAIIAPSVNELPMLKNFGLSNLLFYDRISCNPFGKTEFYLKKLFLDCIDRIYEQHTTKMLSSVQTTNDEIHIGFGLHDKTGNYSVWVGVAMQSIIEHTASRLCFHILHDETLNDSNRYKIMQVAANGGHRVLFHLLDTEILKDTEKLMGNYTIGAMFRIMLPELLPKLPKILYLDADILVNRDVKELWDIDISQYALGAVPDIDVSGGLVAPNVVKRGEVEANRYFNSGVLYMNLDRIRELGNMKTEILHFLENTNEDHLPDQDALNYIYKEDTLLLDTVWNYFVIVARRNMELSLEPKLYHYVGTICLLYYRTEVDRLYYETMLRTPWGKENGPSLLSHSVNRIAERTIYLEQLMRQAAPATKKRIYYGEETTAVQNIIQLISATPEDYRIISENESTVTGKLPVKSFSSLETEEKGTYIVLVLPQADNGTAIQKLTNLGLKDGEDYFIIPVLLPSNKGGYV